MCYEECYTSVLVKEHHFVILNVIMKLLVA